MNYTERSLYRLCRVFSIISILWIIPYLSAESAIYLPFPDLPREIVEPESFKNTESVSPQVKTPTMKSPSRKTKVSKSPTTKPYQSTQSIKRLTKDKDDVLVPDHKIEEKMEDAAEEKAMPELKTPPDEEIQPFQEAMSKIRILEKSNPIKAKEDYTNLMKKYSHPYFRSKILLSLAWNSFHRDDFLSSLDYTIRILEDESLVSTQEYPNAFYIAYSIHGKPWPGKSVSFQKRYAELFHKNLDAGKDNFKSSLYITKLPRPNE